jgi:hypothetical protein
VTVLRSLAAALLWLVAAIAIALGAAGLVTAMDPPPSELGRTDLTASGDAIVAPRLDAIEAQVATLANDVDLLGVQARGALAALSGADQATVDAAIAAGDAHLLDATIGALAIRHALDAVPLIGTPEDAYRVSDTQRARFERLARAVAEVDGLESAWAGLGTGSLAASRLSGLLADHDAAIETATGQGRDAEYAAAIETIATAAAAISEARELRDTLARTVDVTVLDQWLDRNAAYDDALRDLYAALDGVGGRVTDDVRVAIDAEQAARERLPGDSRGLILIMAEIGRGGMNHAVIAIEEARGAMADALAPIAPSDAPGATPPP